MTQSASCYGQIALKWEFTCACRSVNDSLSQITLAKQKYCNWLCPRNIHHRRTLKKSYARHHALDLYRIVATLTKNEYDLVEKFVGQYRDNSTVTEVKQIIRQDFISAESLGSIRLREHELFTPEMRLDVFLEALNDLFRERD